MTVQTLVFVVAAWLAGTGVTFGADAVPAVGAVAFGVGDVRLLDGPFKTAQDVDRAYLLRLDADRFLSGFRSVAGLPKKADPYGGWETIKPGDRFTTAGQTLGHYLSALSMMAAATGDAECKKRVDYIVGELAACQNAKGSGMLFAAPEPDAMFAEIAAGNIRTDHLFKLNDGYVPFYVIHKVMAGLRDAHQLTGNTQARDVFVRQGRWVAGLFDKLSDAQAQEVLETEHGGIMEAMLDVYAITGDPKLLVAAKKLNHRRMFVPLSEGRDVLGHEHANAQIPKAIGMEKMYALTGDKPFGAAAAFFWDAVATKRTFVIGGHGADEFFFDPNQFESKGIEAITGPETCNSYNMVKLSRQLWLRSPSADKADFIERALWNHLLASQDPDHGGFVYFTPMRPGHYRTYSCDTDDMWCCVGTGMEDHAMYGGLIYARSRDAATLWIDQMIASELRWKDAGVGVKLETTLPDTGTARLTFTTETPKTLAVMLRRPAWAKTMTVRVRDASGETIAAPTGDEPGNYVAVRREWRTGDVIEVEWPMDVRTEMLPGSARWAAVLRGPVVLAAKLGTAGLNDFDFNNSHQYAATNSVKPITDVPAFTGPATAMPGKVTQNGPLAFTLAGLEGGRQATLAPFFMVHRERYAIYWKVTD